MTLRRIRRRAIAGSMLVLAVGLVSLPLACGEDASEAEPTASPDGGGPREASPPDASEAETTPPASSDIDAFCKQTLGRYAPQYAKCCDPKAAPERYSFDETLLEGLGTACAMTLAKSVGSGRAELVSTAAASCAQSLGSAIDARTCPDVLRKPSNQPTASVFADGASCSGVIVGHQAAGAPCANDYECVDGTTCVGWTTSSDGTCAAPPGVGAPCGYAVPDGGTFFELVRWGFGTHPRCAAGLYCASTASRQGTCKATQGDGGSCTTNAECADGLRCQLGACGTAGPAPADAPCKQNSDCQDRLYCKSSGGGSVCAPREVAGTPCSNELGSECQGACVKPDGGSASCVAYCGSQ